MIDLEELRITADVQLEFVKAMKMNLTQVSWSEVYTALGTGIVKGLKNGIFDITGMWFH